MKKLVIVILLCLAAAVVFGQARPTLAILPFTGGSGGEGEALAELFSFDRTISGAFTPVPRTSITSAIKQEQKFQMDSGMTDPETIARLGRQMGARFIVAGSITRLGSQQLLIITIMQIENLQQIAGEWRTYRDLLDIRGQLPDIAKNIVTSYQKDSSRLQKLAVLPFQTQSGDREADALAQTLAIEIAKAGSYAVFPRTKTLEQVQTEYKTQTSGNTDDYSIAAIGHGDNPLLALSGAARRVGQDRMFNAAIINVESGTQVKGDSVDYQVIEDGLSAMQTLAVTLSRLTAEYRVSDYRTLFNAVEAINKQGTGDYTIILTGDIVIGPNDKSISFTGNAQKPVVTVRGDTRERSLTSQRRNEAVFQVHSGITLVLGGNLRISSASYGVFIYNGDGNLRMENGTTIANCGDPGVSVSGTFIMNGGTISGCRVGVFVSADINKRRGAFIMNGGTISGNIGDHGGGVAIYSGATFTMNGGTISGNTATGGSIGRGGGVYVSFDSTFIKTGGTITSDNRATEGNVVYAGNGLERNSAAGPSVRLDSRVGGSAGGWE